MNRREFLKLIGAASLTATVPSVALAGDKKITPLSGTDYNPLSETYGQIISLSDYVKNNNNNNNKTLLNFWSIKCLPCLDEMPDLQEIHQLPNYNVIAYGLDGIQYFQGKVSKAIKDRASTLDKVSLTLIGPTNSEEMKAGFESLLTSNYFSKGKDGSFSMILPTSVIIDRNGNINDILKGKIDYKKLKKKLKN